MYKKDDFKERFKPREYTETQDVKFIKKDKAWYADLPDYLEAGGSFQECVMVAGSDDIIDVLASGSEEVTLTASLKPIRENGVLAHEIILVKIADDIEEYEDAGGASYEAIIINPFGPCLRVQCWLCSVSTFVFNGKHPDVIFIKTKND